MSICVNSKMNKSEKTAKNDEKQIKIGKNLKKVNKNLIKTSEITISDEKIKILTHLGQIIKKIQDNVPENADKLPIYYVDASIILGYSTTHKDLEEIPERVINDSLVEIDWLEEVPIVNGLPIWERLDCEPIVEYRLFKIYRDANKGVSRRSFENLKEKICIKVNALYALSKVYHWQLRVKCFDMFRFAEIEKEKANLIKLMETNHRKAADTVFEKCVNYFKNLGEEKLAKINPKDMLGWFTEAARLTRLSLGLPADKPVTKEGSTKFEKIEIGRIDSKTLNIENKSGEDKKNYLQEVVDIMDMANALPKKIEAKKNLQEELSKKELKKK